jgi:predicted site-specific integrase-resolvase
MIASASIRPHVPAVNSLVSIGQASKALGISAQTLRAASNSGTLKTYILPSGHRRYSLSDCYSFLGQGEATTEQQQQKVIIYARVSSAKQASGFSRGEANNDLARQLDSLLQFVKTEYGCSDPVVFRDVGSGISFAESARPGFNRLMAAILKGEFDGATLVCNYPDRLARVAFDLVELICKAHNITIRVVNEVPDQDLEQEFAQDVLNFTHVYSCRMYSRRSAEKLRVAPTADVVKRILELSNNGCASRVIVERLQSEGISTDSKGRQITKSVIARILKETASAKELIVSAPKTNSFGRFAATHVKLLGDSNGSPIQHGTLMTHFKNWCEKNNESPIRSCFKT